MYSMCYPVTDGSFGAAVLKPQGFKKEELQDLFIYFDQVYKMFT